MEPHAQKAAAVVVWSNIKVGLVLSIFHSCEKPFDSWLLFETKIGHLLVFASFENQTFHFDKVFGNSNYFFKM